MLVAQPRRIAPCSVSSRTSRRCAPVPQAASWTRPARDALPEAGRLRGMVRLVSPRNAIWDLGFGEATSEAMVTSQHGQFRTSLVTWPILAIGQAPLPAFA